MKNRLRVLLAENKLTIDDLHRGTGISCSTLSRLKREESDNPEIQTLIKIAQFFNVGLDDLIEME